MAKDYAKKRGRNTKKSSKKPKQTKSLSIPLLSVALVLLCAFAFGLNTISKHGNPSSAPVKTVQAPKSKPHGKEQKAVQQPRFEFYTLLPKIEVQTNKTNKAVKPENVAKAEKTPATPSKVTSEPAQYILQIASVRNFHDADRLKAQLSLAGFDVSIQALKHNNEDWFRVQVGPYPSKRIADNAKKRLTEQNISSIMRRYS